MADPFIGEICMFACQFAPRNWAMCDGSYISISQNPTLFSVIGNIYGGNGHTEMRLPDLQGRAPMHWGTGPGLNPHFIGEKSGLIAYQLDVNEIPSHDHVMMGVRVSGTSGTPQANLYMGVDRGSEAENINFISDDATPNASMDDDALNLAGKSVPHENRQPYAAVNFCIAFDGYYPPRN
ncbi:phage tail protein [Teredinibacter sp. KSP-S5-2]|uniref:phage tail protein n=1 Tax=Teredinibacter sp. KSP-S5-2 TaxID=3034506 RepID=UPI002934566C|nr:tail fiber protein [Teredinibacter sp. KSP-S5-2]WNO09089.1 tail fiber protein [Teredinibacter sp. KSP-S5-2]